MKTLSEQDIVELKKLIEEWNQLRDQWVKHVVKTGVPDHDIQNALDLAEKVVVHKMQVLEINHLLWGEKILSLEADDFETPVLSWTENWVTLV